MGDLQTARFTVKQVAERLGKDPKEITSRIRKGGITEVQVDETEEGFRYLLTERSIDQLGAIFKVMPKPQIDELEKSEQEMTKPINKSALDSEVKRIGISASSLSKVLGKADTYLANCRYRGRIGVDVLNEMNRIFGTDQNAIICEEAQVQKDQASPSQTDPDELRRAVYNGMVDAMIENMKNDMICRAIVRSFESEEFTKAINKAVYGALNGIRAQEARDENHTGLIPQVKR